MAVTLPDSLWQLQISFHILTNSGVDESRITAIISDLLSLSSTHLMLETLILKFLRFCCQIHQPTALTSLFCYVSSDLLSTSSSSLISELLWRVCSSFSFSSTITLSVNRVPDKACVVWNWSPTSLTEYGSVCSVPCCAFTTVFLFSSFLSATSVTTS